MNNYEKPQGLQKMISCIVWIINQSYTILFFLTFIIAFAFLNETKSLECFKHETLVAFFFLINVM